MAFWSGETLLDKLPGLITPFNPDNIDCASYTLTIGREIYVSPTEETPDPKSTTKQLLRRGEAFCIPPGQFAFLVTEEIVTVPRNALGLISMKARIKFKGLVNVSGFHVDPGYRGQLTYSVFNAGPATVHLEQGEPCFLIWYAYLDHESNKVKDDPIQRGLDPDRINSISGELHSLEALAKRIKSAEQSFTDRVHSVEQTLAERQHRLEQSVGERMHAVESTQSYYNAVTYIGIAIVAVIVGAALDSFFRSPSPPVQLLVPATGAVAVVPSPSILALPSAHPQPTQAPRPTPTNRQ
jgi:dCTP deaminase